MQNSKLQLKILRKKYPRFIYRKYSYRISADNNLKISFDFKIEPDIFFRPKIVIEKVSKKQIKRVGERILNNLIFHLGLIEIPSYWKATCSPEILIQAGSLNPEQIKWWKDLIMKGMGQFFYENKINFHESNFLKIKTSKLLKPKINNFPPKKEFKDSILVPIGGGKDSIVTLEKLIAERVKERGGKIGCFLVNPSKAMREIVRVAGIKNSVIVRREIDPALLELNKKGFLNGHTPITAVLSFLSILAAVLFGYKNIAFSNEKSANEGNVKYLGKTINHQWSKSSEFEKKFRHYCQKYLVRGINYFSYLRKYSEMEIAKMFTKYPQYFSVFSSCNVVLAKKLKKRWCANCPKCLFVYASLYPFLKREQLLKIFGTDIFENKKLLPVMKGLINPEMAKPFECVGTKRENQTIFKLSLEKAKKEGKTPYLLTKLNEIM